MSKRRISSVLVVLSVLAIVAFARADNWTTTYRESENYDGDDQAVQTTVDSDGNIYVLITGTNEDNDATDIVALRFDANAGNNAVPAFEWIYHDEENEDNLRAVAFALKDASGTNADELYVLGSDEDEVQFLTLKFATSSPTPVWHLTTDYNAGLTPVGIALGPGGGWVAVTGTATRPTNPPNHDFITFRYNADGTPGSGTWPATYDGDQGLNDDVSAIMTDELGNIYVTGTSQGVEYDFCTVKYSPDVGGPGDAWVYEDEHGLDGSAMRIGRYMDRIFVAGEVEGDADFIRVVWHDRASGAVMDYVDYTEKDGENNLIDVEMKDMTVYSTVWDGYIYITAVLDSCGFTPWTTVAFKPDLHRLWTKQGGRRHYWPSVVPPEDIEPSAIAVDFDHNVYVVGFAYAAVQMVKYDLWGVQRYTYDVAASEDVDPHVAAFFTQHGAPWIVVVGSVLDVNTGVDVLISRNDMRLPGTWTQMADVPLGPKEKRVKDGGCLAYEGPDQLVYALKGNGRYEFYQYNIETNTWATKESIPAIGSSGKKKAVKKGAAMAVGTDNQTRAYAVKGNNTLEFWEYVPEYPGPPTYPWFQHSDVPIGAGRRIKEGSGMVSVSVEDQGNPVNYIYLLKGSATYEFYRCNVSNGYNWEARATAPTGSSGKPYKDGSCLAYVPPTAEHEQGVIFALKGTYNELFAYDVATNSWTTKTPMPLIGSSGRKKKAKNGAGLAYQNGRLCCLKGNNTQEFWQYVVDSDLWHQHADMPIGGGKKVKGGGALISDNERLWALKGNNTYEFWQCRSTSELEGPGVSGQPSPPGPNEFQIAGGEDLRQPAWNAAGDWVCLVKPDQAGRYQVWKAKFDGFDSAELTAIEGDCSKPVWNDDSLIVFEIEPAGSPYSQIAVVPASGGTVTMLTSDSTDHCDPSWDPSGTVVLYAADDDSIGYRQVFSVSAQGGTPTRLTWSGFDHEQPKFLNSTQIVFLREGEDEYDHLFVTGLGSGIETQLSSLPLDHDRPCVAGSTGAVTYQIALTCAGSSAAWSQIGLMTPGQPGEVILTGGQSDFESPTITSDGLHASCTRVSGEGAGAALCRVDPVNGGYTMITDDRADRSDPCITANNALCVVSSVYSREDGIYRTIGEGTVFVPRAQIEVNPGHPDSVALTDVPLIVIKALVSDTLGWADSMKVVSEHRFSTADTLPTRDDFGWTAYDSFQVWRLNHGQGRYRFDVRFMLVRGDSGQADTSIVLSDACVLDLVAPSGSVAIKCTTRFYAARVCTLIVAGSDDSTGTGLGAMRFSTQAFKNLLQNSDFLLDASGWEANHFVYHESLGGIVELPQIRDSLVYFGQMIPSESLEPYLGCPACLSLAGISEGLQPKAALELLYCLVKAETELLRQGHSASA